MSKHRVLIMPAEYKFQPGQWSQWINIGLETILLKRSIDQELKEQGVTIIGHSAEILNSLSGNDLIVLLRFNASDNQAHLGSCYSFRGFTPGAKSDLELRLKTELETLGFTIGDNGVALPSFETKAKMLGVGICYASHKADVEIFRSKREQIVNRLSAVIAKGRVSKR